MNNFEFDFSELFDDLKKNVKEDIKTFEDVLNLSSALAREIYIGEIEAGIGQSVEGIIRFWNDYDTKNNIAIEKRQPIKIFIDSIGGSLTDAFTIIDAIKISKTPVWTIVTGCAYSGGFFIAINGHRKMAYPHASFLYHEGSTATHGDAGKFRNFADFYQKQLDQLKDITINNTLMTEEYYKEHQRDDLWLTAPEALELGVCDEIIRDIREI